ncbi:MAG: DUF418 domain-containing protein [Gammaproteobacteria bacterium]|nr:DUF418 domain-containing protein [Gammaproteobacteria bacterium]MBU1554634.1 DUF418 domain-containing protein [Gammaproteobacteria bacterium]MBU2071531.1 DUF418 domain-containing protein [Gammaproteobacteria bacterium]MBU2184022.1 DUF418 domain-containing protein [Gammaproteobacteria bacterium]MBU2206892.1 DUF418 domain-containing protein [Gammaproteobacteria bacterium]
MQRLPQLDIIRGFAVLGILLMNIFAFAYPIDYAHSLIWHEAGVSLVDTSLYNLQTLLISGRFLTLFNLLFGISMWLILQQYGQGYLQRRLYWLCLFGLVHGVFLWSGDILLWYALAGLIVLKQGYLQLDSSDLWRKAVRFFAYGLIMPLFYMVYLLWAQTEPLEALTAETLAAQQQLWTGSYLEQLIQNAIYAVLMLIAFALTWYWLMAAIMLFGVSLYKSAWFDTGYSTAMTKTLFWLAFVISSVTVLLDHVSGYGYGLNTALPWEQLAMLLMALSFASVLIHRRDNAWLQRWLAPCGRMAFSLYIGQTLLMVLLFRVIRPDWFASLDRTALLGIASSMILLQLLCCRWYFSHFNQGPLEWCWRVLSKKPATTG